MVGYVYISYKGSTGNLYKITKKINMLRKIWIGTVATAAILTKNPTNAMIIIACCLL